MFDGVVEAIASIDPAGRRGLGPPSTDGYRSTDDIFIPIESRGSATGWYYMNAEGLIAGYDNKSKRLIGWLGPEGFTAGEGMPAAHFQGATQSYWHGESLIAFPDAVYRVDLHNRTVAKVFTAPAGESILGAGDSSAGDDDPPSARFHVIATTRNVYVQSEDGVPLLTVPRDPEASDYGFVAIYRATQAPGAPMVVWYAPEGGSKFSLSSEMEMPLKVTWVNNDGTLGTHVSLPRFAGSLWNPFSSAVMLAMPLALTSAIDVVAKSGLMHRDFIPRQNAVGLVWPGLLGVVIAGFLFARGRAYAFSSGRLVLWTVLGFLLGPLALASMFALIDWPAKETCAACGKKRIATRKLCEHCHAAFPAPDLDGTEIFDELTETETPLLS
jgi:hypothetical protein